MTTQPESILDKNGKVMTVHKKVSKSDTSAKKRKIPNIKKAEGVRSYKEFHEKIDSLSLDFSKAHEGIDRDITAESIDILNDMVGNSPEDMMTFDGMLDFLAETYNQDNRLYQASVEITNWLYRQQE